MEHRLLGTSGPRTHDSCPGVSLAVPQRRERRRKQPPIHLEMTETDLQQIQSTPWIRDRFFVTDLLDNYWMGFYGTTTLVDERLSVQRVFRVLHSASWMQRDGLFVDVDVGQERAVRLCNSHLKSLTSNPPRRPLQFRLVSARFWSCLTIIHKTINTPRRPPSRRPQRLRPRRPHRPRSTAASPTHSSSWAAKTARPRTSPKGSRRRTGYGRNMAVVGWIRCCFVGVCRQRG